MGIWENLGMGGYRGFSRPAARLLQQAVQLAGDLGCEQADTSHLLLAMLQQQGAAAQFLTRKNITEPEVRRQLAQDRRRLFVAAGGQCAAVVGIVRTGTGDDRYAVIDRIHGELDGGQLLLIGHGRTLAGGAADDDGIGMVRDLILRKL
jgi:hypothetical protein